MVWEGGQRSGQYCQSLCWQAGHEEGQSFGTAQFSSQASSEERRWQTDPKAVLGWDDLVVLVLIPALFGAGFLWWFYRQWTRAVAKAVLEPGMTFDKYASEAFDWIDDLGTGKFKIQWNGLWWRLTKLYWKRTLFILLCLVFQPGGLVILLVCAAVWALNYERAMDALVDADWERFKREQEIRRNKPSAKAARAVSCAVRKSLWFTVRGTWRGLWKARRAWKDLKEGR